MNHKPSVHKINFTGNEFYITQQSVDDIHIKIVRYVRTTTMEGMQQPIKVGVSMGVDTRLELKKGKKPFENGEWKLSLNNDIVQYGVTDMAGTSDGLNISIFNNDKYELLICDNEALL